MSTARHPRPSTSGGPAGWVVLLALMFLALVIAGISKGCGGNDTAQTGTTGATTSGSGTGTGTTTGGAQGSGVIDQINQVVTQAGGITFETGSVQLTAASKGSLDQVAAVLAQNPAVKVEIGAHTDSQGDADKNLTLSQQRANAVMTYLTQTKGIQASRLKAVGYGETQLLVPNETTEAQRKQNRRVEFKLIS